MTRRRGGFGSRIADNSLQDVLARSGTPVRVEDLPEYIDVPVTDAWRRWVETNAVDIPRLTGARVKTKDAVLTLSLETLLGSNGPGPTPGNDVTIVAIKDGVVLPVSAPEALRITTGGEALPVAVGTPLDVRIASQAATLAVAAAITGRGTAAAAPLYVNVVNQTPSAEGLEPASAKEFTTGVSVAKATSTNGAVTIGPATMTVLPAIVSGFDAKFARARSLEINAAKARTGDRSWYNPLQDPAFKFIVASGQERECLRQVIGFAENQSATQVFRVAGSVAQTVDLDTTNTTSPQAQVDINGGWRPIPTRGAVWTVLGLNDYMGSFTLPTNPAPTFDLAIHFDLLGTYRSEQPRDAKGRFAAA